MSFTGGPTKINPRIFIPSKFVVLSRQYLHKRHNSGAASRPLQCILISFNLSIHALPNVHPKFSRSIIRGARTLYSAHLRFRHFTWIWASPIDLRHKVAAEENEGGQTEVGCLESVYICTHQSHALTRTSH